MLAQHVLYVPLRGSLESPASLLLIAEAKEMQSLLVWDVASEPFIITLVASASQVVPPPPLPPPPQAGQDQPDILAVPPPPPPPLESVVPQRINLMISGRFNDQTKMNYMRHVKDLLCERSVPVGMVKANYAGATFGDQTALLLYKAKACLLSAPGITARKPAHSMKLT